MIHIRVTIVVRGPTRAEVAGFLPELPDEFKERESLTRASTSWDTSRGGLAVTIDCEDQDTTVCADTILDEVRDCVVACLPSSTDIWFLIADSSCTSVA